MSRIHEALKKAEQERATSENIPQIAPDPDPAVLDARVYAEVPSHSAAAPAVAITGDGLLSRTRHTNWKPDAKTMLFSPAKSTFTEWKNSAPCAAVCIRRVKNIRCQRCW